MVLLSGQNLAPVWVQGLTDTGVACASLAIPGLDLDRGGVDDLLIAFGVDAQDASRSSPTGSSQGARGSCSRAGRSA